MRIIVDFSGGLDLVFNNFKEIKLQLKESSTIDILVNVLGNQYAKQKKQMFWVNGKVRPGILVLVNEVDWELLEKQNTILQDKDKVSFISTLHGG